MIMSKKKNICSISTIGVAVLGTAAAGAMHTHSFGGKRVGAGDGYFFGDVRPMAGTL